MAKHRFLVKEIKELTDTEMLMIVVKDRISEISNNPFLFQRLQGISAKLREEMIKEHMAKEVDNV